MTDIKRLLGSNIKNYRTSLGISQAQLAEMVSMAPNYLGLIEGGRKFPSADMLERIAAALGKDSPDLFALAPLRHEWKETILTKIDKIINDELNALRRKT